MYTFHCFQQCHFRSLFFFLLFSICVTNNNTSPLSPGSAKSFCVCVKLLILCTVSVFIKKKSQSLFKLFHVYKINLNISLNPLVLASYSNTHSNVFSHTTSTTYNKNTWNLFILMLADVFWSLRWILDDGSSDFY